MRKMYRAEFDARLLALILEYMPWPYSDVERYDLEGREAAAAIADVLKPVIDAEFGAMAMLSNVRRGPQRAVRRVREGK